MPIDQLPVGANGKNRTISSASVERYVPRGTLMLRGILPEDVPLLWKWLNEYPKQNFDDYGQRSLEEFTREIARRVEAKELVIGVTLNNELVGMIGYLLITERWGYFHGICFSKEVHRTGLAYAAVSRFLDKLFGAGKAEKVSARYFQDNERIKKFLRNLGFVHEGLLKESTVRNGIRINQCDVSLLKRDWRQAQKVQ